MMGAIQADQDTSFQAMDKILVQMINIIVADPAVDTVNGFTGGGENTARMFISLKPLAERKISAISSSRDCGRSSPGCRAPRSICRRRRIVRVGGRFGSAQYQFTMRGDNLQDLTDFAPRMLQQLTSVSRSLPT